MRFLEIIFCERKYDVRKWHEEDREMNMFFFFDKTIEPRIKDEKLYCFKRMKNDLPLIKIPLCDLFATMK